MDYFGMKREGFFSSKDLIKLISNPRDLSIYAFYLRENAFNGLECGMSFKESSSLLAQTAGIFLYLESSEDQSCYGFLKEVSLLEASELYYLQAKRDGRFSNSLLSKICTSIYEGYGRVPKSFKEIETSIKSIALAKKYYYESLANFYAGECEELEKLKYARYCLSFQVCEKSIRIFKRLEYPGLLYKSESWKATLLTKIPSPGKIQMIWNSVPPLQPFDGPIVMCIEFNLSQFMLPSDIPEFLQVYIAKPVPKLKALNKVMYNDSFKSNHSTHTVSKPTSRPVSRNLSRPVSRPVSRQQDVPDEMITQLSDALVNCRRCLWGMESDLSQSRLNSSDIISTLKDINNLLDTHETEFKNITATYSDNCYKGSKVLVKPIYDSSKQLDLPKSNVSFAVVKYELDSIQALQQRIDSLSIQCKLNIDYNKRYVDLPVTKEKKESFVKHVWQSLQRKPKPSKVELQHFKQSAEQVDPKAIHALQEFNQYKEFNQHSRFFSEQSTTAFKVPRLRSRTNDKVLQWLNSKPESSEFTYPILF